MPTSLVTGGAGFIGSYIVEELLAKNNRVIVLDDLSGGRRQNVPQGAQFIQGSILDVQLLEKLFSAQKIDFIYHLAAYAAEGLSHFIKRYNYQNNLIGSVNLINEAVKHKVKCFVFTSSIAVYGGQTPPMNEEMIPTPEDPYGIAKYAVEMELEACKKMFGLDYIIFRPHNVYGERQNISDKYRNVIGIFMNQLLNEDSLSIFGNGNQTRAFSYIKDIAPIIAQSVKNKEMYGEVFNIGSDLRYSVTEIAELVMKAMSIKGELKFLDERQEVQHAYASHNKLRKHFELDTTSLEVGLINMATWAKSASHPPTKDFDALEITKNLPPFWK